MKLVVDASVAVKFLVAEHDTEKARELLRTPDLLIAPDWLFVEAANTFWKKVKRSELLVVHAERHLDDLPLFFARTYRSDPLIGEAFRLAIRLRHPVYDCVYLALAIREDCPMITADKEFRAVLARNGFADRVRLL